MFFPESSISARKLKTLENGYPAMDASLQFEQLIEQIERLGMDVRYERLGGQSTGLCRIRGQPVMFIDLDADVATRIEQCLQALASVPDVDSTFLPPAIRERLDRLRKSGGQQP